GFEETAPPAYQHAHGITAIIGDGQIGDAICVEIPHGDRVGSVSGGEAGGNYEGATPQFPQEHGHRSMGGVSYGEVLNTIVVEISYRHRAGTCPNGRDDGHLKEAVVPAQQQAHGGTV